MFALELNVCHSTILTVTVFFFCAQTAPNGKRFDGRAVDPGIKVLTPKNN